MIKIIKRKFRNIPITIKVTIWYTIFITFLLSSIIGGAFFIKEKVGDEVNKKELTDTVTKVANGRDKFKPYDDGVSLALYDENNNLIGGYIPENFSISNSLEYGVVKEFTANDGSKYLYYDVKITGGKNQQAKFVRGVIQTSKVKEQTNFLLIGAIILSPLLILIISYGGYRIIKNAFKPVREMTKTAEEISKSSDLSKRITIEEGRDEVHKLATVFNSMLETLEKSSIREKKFSSDVSHELRTPVAVIRAESEYGVKYTDNVEEAKESFEVIERQSKRMTTMINQILELSRLDNDSQNIEKSELNFSQLLLTTIDDYKKIFSEKNIVINSNIESNINLIANRALIERVVDNLLSNAMKFTNSEIVINLYKKDKVVFEVIDNGIGIEDKEKEKIWDRFYKVDKSRTTTEDNSSGLGLPITKKIIELHGGTIKVKDNNPKGTRFVVEI